MFSLIAVRPKANNRSDVGLFANNTTAFGTHIGLLMLTLVFSSAVSADPNQPSADINGDGTINSADLGLFLNDLGFVGASPSDLDLDGRVAPLCDGVYMMEQFPGAPGSTASVSANYDSSTGTGSVTVTPSTVGPGGVAAVYLVNTLGTITGGSFTVPASSTTIFNTAPSPGVVSLTPSAVTSGYPITASSVQHYAGSDTIVGTSLDLVTGSFTKIPTSASFTVPPTTSVSDLQFFYQLVGQGAVPIPIFDQVAQTTYVANPNQFPCGCPVPEPATLPSFLLSMIAVGAIVRRKRMFRSDTTGHIVPDNPEQCDGSRD